MTFILGFFPPAVIVVDNLVKFDMILLGGLLLFCLPAVLSGVLLIGRSDSENNN